MKSKSLLSTNRYLRDASKSKALLIRSIASSTAIETGEAISVIEAKLNHPRSTANPVKLA